MRIAPDRDTHSSAAPRQRSSAQRLVSSSRAPRSAQLDTTQHSARSTRAVRPRSSTRSGHAAGRGRELMLVGSEVVHL
jgi:hypothetical protein